MRFWDASVIIPLVVTESTTPELQALAAEDRVMLVWWATTYKVYAAEQRTTHSGLTPAHGSVWETPSRREASWLVGSRIWCEPGRAVIGERRLQDQPAASAHLVCSCAEIVARKGGTMSQALPLVWITWICAAGAYVAAQGGQPTLRSFTPTEEVLVTGAEVAPSAARAGSSTFAFRGAARCSPDGTAALVPYLPGAPAGSVVRVERDGRRTVVQLATALDVSPDHIDIGAIAHGDSGKVYVLVLTADVNSRVPRQVLSVSSDGSVRRIGNVQEGDDFIAKDLAVMTSGDVLLAGVRPHSGRLATSILTDAGVQSPVLELPTVEPAAGIYAAAGSSDGAYVVDERNA